MYTVKTNKHTDKQYIQFIVNDIPAKANLPSLAPYRRKDGTFLIEVRRMSNGNIHIFVCERILTHLAQLIVQIKPYPPIADGDLDGMYKRAMRWLEDKNVIRRVFRNPTV